MKNKIEFTDKELHLIQSACSCLWDSLDIINSELKYRDTDVSKSTYEQNIKDMKILDRIINKIRKIDNGKNKEIDELKNVNVHDKSNKRWGFYSMLGE